MCHLRGHVRLDLHQRGRVAVAITVMRKAVVPTVQSEIAIHKTGRQSNRARGVGLDRQRDQLHHRLQVRLRALALRRLGMVGLRLWPVHPRFLLHDLLFQRPHRLEVFLKLVLILFAELALHALRLLQHHIENTAVQLELLPLLGLVRGRFLEE